MKLNMLITLQLYLQIQDSLRSLLDDHPVAFEYGTGATLTTMSLDIFTAIHPQPNLKPTGLQLSTYTGEVIEVVGYATVDIDF